MKIKPLYIYSLIIVLAIAFLIFSSKGKGNNNPHAGSDMKGNMPNDQIHKGLNGSMDPSKGNVSENVKHMMAMMEKAYQQNPDDTLKAREYADFLASAHQSDKAIPIYERILQKNPRRTDVRFSMAYIYFMQQNFDKSEQAINEVLNYDKNNVLAQYNKGLILISKGEKEKGKSIWQDLINKHPNDEIGMRTREAIKELK